MINAVISAAFVLAAATTGVVTVFPLSDPSDPILVSGGIFDTKDADAPAIWVQLENTTSRPLPANQIWLRASQFFTPSEMARNRDNVPYSCGRIARAEFDEVTDALPPHQHVTARFQIGTDCALDAPHVHLFIHVSSIGPGPIDEQIWRRDPPSFARLLAAAMPHP